MRIFDYNDDDDLPYSMTMDALFTISIVLSTVVISYFVFGGFR